MSRIYFHAPHRTAEVGGSERAYFSVMARDLAIAILKPDRFEAREWLEPLMTGEIYPFMPDRWAQGFETWFSGMSNGAMLVDGEPVGCMDLALNTLVAMNSPQMSFIAHVHGTCEIHGWIEAENARWLSDLIRKGREDNVFRAGQGWEDVMTLAQEVAETGNGPIVMSYSVCEGFPNAGAANWEAPTCEACGGGGEPNPRMKYTDVEYDHCTTCDGEGSIHDAWYDLPDDERWRLGVEALRNGTWPFAMGPDRQGQGYMTGKSVFDLMAGRWTGQLAPADA